MKKLLTLLEVGELLHISEPTVRRGWYDGNLSATIRVGKKSIRWRVDDLQKWVEEQGAAVVESE